MLFKVETIMNNLEYRFSAYLCKLNGLHKTIRKKTDNLLNLIMKLNLSISILAFIKRGLEKDCMLAFR